MVRGDFFRFVDETSRVAEVFLLPTFGRDPAVKYASPDLQESLVMQIWDSWCLSSASNSFPSASVS